MVLMANFTSQKKHYFMISPQFATNSVACFKFDYYFLFDSITSILNVSLINNNNRDQQTLVWSASGIDIDDWSYAEVQIEQKGIYQVSK